MRIDDSFYIQTFLILSEIVYIIYDLKKIIPKHASVLQNMSCNVSLFFNPGYKVLILVESKGQICPIVFHLLGPCPLDQRTTIH